MPTTWSMFVRPTPASAWPFSDDRDVAGQERAGVVRAVDERVDRVAVGRDRRALDGAELVLVAPRLHDAARAARDRLAVRLRRVGHGERDVADAVAVARVVLRDLVLLAQRARDDEADVALLEHVRGAVAHSRLGPGVRRPREAHRVLVEVRSLLCVADPELDVVPAEQRHEVFGHVPIMPRARRRRRNPCLRRARARRRPPAPAPGPPSRTRRRARACPESRRRARLGRPGPGRLLAQDAEARVAAGVGTDTRGPLTRPGRLPAAAGAARDRSRQRSGRRRRSRAHAATRRGSGARRERRRTAACC